MKNKIQLITYVDRFGKGTISDLRRLLSNELKGLFGGVHILPFFYPIDGEDAGFDPINHKQIDARLGDWNDLRQLSAEVDIMSDLIVNHISAKSIEFLDYIEKGDCSVYSSLILTKEKVFPVDASSKEIAKIYRPRPGKPFTNFKLKDGSEVVVWTTFTSNQIDIDVKSSLGMAYLEGILDTFQKANITMIRLDAAGYAIKKAGTSCFMIDETYDFISKLTQRSKLRGIKVLVEIHSFYKTQIEIAKRVDYVYDFALPVLVLDCLFNKNTNNLEKWLAIAPRNVVTVLDTHDGIGIVDVAGANGEPGLIADEILDQIVETIHTNSKGTSKKATGSAANNLDLYQVNCTYFDALGQDEQAYLMARAIQFFVPGVPQVYYVGLMAGVNDLKLLEETNVGRDINRHYYQKQEIEEYIDTVFFKKLQKLMVFRNSHSAFNGEFKLIKTPATELQIKWENKSDWALLRLNLNDMSLAISYTKTSGEITSLF